MYSVYCKNKGTGLAVLTFEGDCMTPCKGVKLSVLITFLFRIVLFSVFYTEVFQIILFKMSLAQACSYSVALSSRWCRNHVNLATGNSMTPLL